MSENWDTLGLSSSRASWKARARLQSILAVALGSIGVWSAYAAAMSTPAPARARSSVSVAAHIANRKPP